MNTRLEATDVYLTESKNIAKCSASITPLMTHREALPRSMEPSSPLYLTNNAMGIVSSAEKNIL